MASKQEREEVEKIAQRNIRVICKHAHMFRVSCEHNTFYLAFYRSNYS